MPVPRRRRVVSVVEGTDGGNLKRIQSIMRLIDRVKHKGGKSEPS